MPTLLSKVFIFDNIDSFACIITVIWPGQIDSKKSICDGATSAVQAKAKGIDGANKIKLLLLVLCFNRDIFSHAFIFDASHPRPQTPSVGWIKILPSFSQFDAAAGDENSFKLIY